MQDKDHLIHIGQSLYNIELLQKGKIRGLSKYALYFHWARVGSSIRSIKNKDIREVWLPAEWQRDLRNLLSHPALHNLESQHSGILDFSKGQLDEYKKNLKMASYALLKADSLSKEEYFQINHEESDAFVLEQYENQCSAQRLSQKIVYHRTAQLELVANQCAKEKVDQLHNASCIKIASNLLEILKKSKPNYDEENNFWGALYIFFITAEQLKKIIPNESNNLGIDPNEYRKKRNKIVYSSFEELTSAKQKWISDFDQLSVCIENASNKQSVNDPAIEYKEAIPALLHSHIANGKLTDCVNLLDNYGGGFLSSTNKYYEAFSILEADQNSYEEVEIPLFHMLARTDLETLALYLDQIEDPFLKDSKERNIFHNLSVSTLSDDDTGKKGQLRISIVNTLISKFGFQRIETMLNQEDERGMSPLVYAVLNHNEVLYIKHLLQNKANPNIVINGKLLILRLLEAMCNPEEENKNHLGNVLDTIVTSRKLELFKWNQTGLPFMNIIFTVMPDIKVLERLINNYPNFKKCFNTQIWDNNKKVSSPIFELVSYLERINPKDNEKATLYLNLFLKKCYNETDNHIWLIKLCMHYIDQKNDAMFLQIVSWFFERGVKRELNIALDGCTVMNYLDSALKKESSNEELKAMKSGFNELMVSDLRKKLHEQIEQENLEGMESYFVYILELANTGTIPTKNIIEIYSQRIDGKNAIEHIQEKFPKNALFYSTFVRESMRFFVTNRDMLDGNKKKDGNFTNAYSNLSHKLMLLNPRKSGHYPAIRQALESSWNSVVYRNGRFENSVALQEGRGQFQELVQNGASQSSGRGRSHGAKK